MKTQIKDKICPICSSNKLELKIIDEVYKFKGKEKIFKNCKIWKCSSCNEEFIDEDYYKTIRSEIKDFIKGIDNEKEIYR